MAYVQKGTWDVSFGFIDNNDKVATCSLKFDGGRTHPEVEALALAAATAFDAVSDARLFTYSISRGYTNDDTTPPPATSEVERKLAITLGTVSRDGASTIEIPSPIFALEQPRTDVPDPNNLAYIALITFLTQGLPTPGNGPVTWFGADLTRVTRALVQHTSRRPKAD